MPEDKATEGAPSKECPERSSSGMLRRVLRFLAYVSLVLVCLKLSCGAANSIRYRAARPSAAEACNYEGEWRSDRAFSVGGRILVEMPYPPPVNTPFTVKAWVYYDITSIYRTGRYVPMELEGLIEEGSTASGGNPDKPVVLRPRISFKSKSFGDGASEQVVDYVCTGDTKFTQISGGYRSQSPADIGRFALEKVK